LERSSATALRQSAPIVLSTKQLYEEGKGGCTEKPSLPD